MLKLFSKFGLNRHLDGVAETSLVCLSINHIFDRNPGDMQGLTSLYDIIGCNYVIRYQF